MDADSSPQLANKGSHNARISTPIIPKHLERKGILLASGSHKQAFSSQPNQIATGDFPDIAQILSSNERNEVAGKQLLDHIKHFSFFEALNTKNFGTRFDEFGLTQVCMKLKYEKFTDRKMLFQQGDLSNGMVYLVYSGEVSLYKKNPDFPISDEKNPEAENKAESPLKHRVKTLDDLSSTSKPIRPALKYQKTRLEVEISQNQKIEKIITHSQLDKKIKSGDFFGEQALFDWGHRTFSAITNGPCEVLILKKRDFKFLRENFDEKRKTLKKLLEELVKKAGFLDVPYIIGEISSIAEEKIFERGATLTNEGESEDTFYILSEGTCELVKNVRVDETMNLEDNLVSIKQLLRIAPIYNEVLTVCTVSKGSFLGEEILFVQQQVKSFFTVRVTSSVATVFAFKKREFVHKIPLNFRKEVENLFEAKRAHYSQAINSILVNKYPNMNHALNFENNSDTNLLINPIVLVPTKNKNLNLKVRSGIFRGEKRNNGCVSERLSVTPEKDTKGTKNTGSEVKDRNQTPLRIEPKGDGSEKHALSPVKIANAPRKVPEIDLLKLQKKREDNHHVKVSEKTRVNSLENLKFKISRTHVNNDVVNKTGYVSTTPIPFARHLTERGLSMKRLLIEAMEDGDYSARSNRELKTEETLLESERMMMDNSPLDFYDYGNFAPPSGVNMLNNFSAVTDHSKTIPAGRGSPSRRIVLREKSEDKEKEKEKSNQETQENLMEIRRQLLGKEAYSKDYLMARKKLELKLHSNMKKSLAETQRDLSFGKRLEDLLKPMRGKMQQKFEQSLENQNNQNSPSTLVNIKTNTEVSISFGPIKQPKSQTSLMLDSSPIALKTSMNLQSDSMNKSIQNRCGTETLFIEGINESLDSDRKVTLSARKLPEIPVSPQQMLKLKKDRNTSLLKYKFIRLKNRNLSNGGDYGVDQTSMKKDRDSSGLHIRAHSLMRNRQNNELDTYYDETR